MIIITGNDLKTFFNSLTEEQLLLPVYFDTCAKKYDYHMALVGAAFCDDDEAMGELKNINLHEAR